MIPSRQSAFTLVELMLVLAIIAIMATIAWSTTIGNRPKSRLTSNTSEVRLQLLKARTAAVRTGRNHKVCIFRDDSAMTLPAKGRMVVFSCNSTGLAGCPGGPICQGTTPDTGAVQWTGTLDSAPCPVTANPTQWCVEPTTGNSALGINLGSTAKAPENVSISRFLTYANPPADSGLDGIEITYIPSGFIDRARSTPSLTSGSIELVNRDLCAGSCSTFADFTAAMRVEYTSGGGARLR